MSYGGARIKRSIIKDERGFVVAYLAVAMTTILVMTALAVDVSTMVAVRSRLENAISLTGLAVSSLPNIGVAQDDEEEAEKVRSYAQEFFNSNFSSSGLKETPEIQVAFLDGTLEISALAQPNVALLEAFGSFNGKSANVKTSSGVRIDADVEITPEFKSVEIVLVMDNTGSMSSRIHGLRNAAHGLLDELSLSPNFEERVRVGFVHYVTAVNIKAASGFDMAWMDTQARARYHGMSFQGFPENKVNHFDLFDGITNEEWKGCVEARPEPYDMTDEPPSQENPDTLWVPWFWPDEPSQSPFDNDYLPDLPNEDLEETPTEGGFPSYAKFDPAKYDDVEGDISDEWWDTMGPNRSCGDPIVPLTNNMELLHEVIDEMQVWGGSGTNTAEGMMWGYRLLSPTPPFIEGAPFDDEDTRKILIVLTDGMNMSIGSGILDSELTPYGYLAHRRIASSNGEMGELFDSKTTRVCDLAKEQEIDVFTVTYGDPGQAVRDLFEDCASRPEHFFNSPTPSDLDYAFRSIAHTLLGTRISG